MEPERRREDVLRFHRRAEDSEEVSVWTEEQVVCRQVEAESQGARRSWESQRRRRESQGLVKSCLETCFTGGPLITKREDEVPASEERLAEFLYSAEQPSRSGAGVE